MGNLLGDFVKGQPGDSRFKPIIWKGIMEHRYIDSYTDNHPDWQQSRELLDPRLRRFAGIVIDIFYDHFLTRNWQLYSTDQSVDDFIAETYADLRKAWIHAPTDVYRVMQQMMEEDWLGNYGTLEGIHETMRRVSNRSSKLEPIRDAADELEKHFDEMESHFLDFFPDLVEFIAAYRRKTKTA